MLYVQIEKENMCQVTPLKKDTSFLVNVLMLQHKEVLLERIRRTPILVTARSKAWVYGRLLAGIAGSNHAGGMNVCLL
jgi:hypothetical protein